MNRNQLNRVMGYLDAEYGGIVSRMTEAERKVRAQHWANEVGPLEFDAVMDAVRELSQGPYMPRTAEVIGKVRERAGSRMQDTAGRCRIFRDAEGREVLDLRFSDGTEQISGYLSAFPEWMQAKFRWMADPSEENTENWDAYIGKLEVRS